MKNLLELITHFENNWPKLKTRICWHWKNFPNDQLQHIHDPESFITALRTFTKCTTEELVVELNLFIENVDFAERDMAQLKLLFQQRANIAKNKIANFEKVIKK